MIVYTTIRDSDKGRFIFTKIKNMGYLYVTKEDGIKTVLLNADELSLPCPISIDTDTKLLDYSDEGIYVTYKEIIDIVENNS